MSTEIRSQPRVRAYGNSRIEITKRAQDEREWQKQWREPIYPFPFKWGATWKQCIEYRVVDFASEVGFFIDILGLPVTAFSPTYAQFTSPDQEFTFAVTAVAEDEPATHPDAIRLQFQVDYLLDTIMDLEDRGILFERRPRANSGSSGYVVACFRSPHGIPIDLVGEVYPDDTVEDEDETESDEFEGDELVEDLGELELEVEDEIEAEQDELDEEIEIQDLSESDDSLVGDLDDVRTPDLPTWMSLLRRQDVQRSRPGQSKAYPRPSKSSTLRNPPHEASAANRTHKNRSNSELTYSTLEDEEQEYEY